MSEGTPKPEDDLDASANPYETPHNPAVPPTRVRWDYSLPMGLTLVGVIVMLCFFNRGAGFLLAVVSIPAYLRAVRKSSVQVAEGFDITNLDRFLFFVASALMVAFFATTAFIAFLVTCSGSMMALEAAGTTSLTWIGYGNGYESIAAIVAFAVSLFAFGWQYWRSWPRVAKSKPNDVESKSGDKQ